MIRWRKCAGYIVQSLTRDSFAIEFAVHQVMIAASSSVFRSTRPTLHAHQIKELSVRLVVTILSLASNFLDQDPVQNGDLEPPSPTWPKLVMAGLNRIAVFLDPNTSD